MARRPTAALPRLSKCTLRVENVSGLTQLRHFKLSKTMLESLHAIRQVDRKFILARVSDASTGTLLLCIDQHAADERVKLEQLERELFGPDGDDLHIDVCELAPPLVMQLNAKEVHTLAAHGDIVRAWGFEFDFVERETDTSWLTTCRHTRPTTQFDDWRDANSELVVELRTTPRVDTRCAGADDFREFVQILSEHERHWSWTVMRPPVITRLLHSRACRSAIMFGDYLSVSQCQELMDALRTCKLPFQCAHGRPSVVPLVELMDSE